ncbi:MAG: tetraacyldisaccharide 4'-kinase [Bacteroidales bacterium]|nr:tetraacyldisaccharide 4'-kinase [Bacteroidales bacterium]
MKRSIIWFMLYPFTLVYGLIVWIRNSLFDLGILPQRTFKAFILVVGNLSAGGTGKTPHVIALAQILRKDYSLAILSRGYKRKSKGFRWIQADDHPELSGDEPLEIKIRLGNIPVATCKNRRKGIDTILRDLHPKPEIIIMDDGFQHRYVKPDYSLVLTKNGSLYSDDILLPAGRLREPIRAIKRAHAVCVSDLDNSTELHSLRKKLQLSDDQDLLSSRIEYSFLSDQNNHSISHILLVTSLASSESLLSKLKTCYPKVSHLRFSDHHKYTSNDIQKIITTFNSISDSQKLIITSGKDLVKLNQFDQFRALPYRCAEIEVIFNKEDAQVLLKNIHSYAEQNK